MEIEVRAPAIIDDGSHKGVITKVEYRIEPFEYTDVHISTSTKNGDNVELKYGCPTIISKVSKLGRLLQNFGANLKQGEKLDPENYLVGKKVTFMTLQEKTEKGTFSRIVEGSVKPLED